MYWIVAKGREGTKISGKTALLGPFNTEATAEEKADELETDSRVVYLPTRNPSRASRMIKAKRVEQNPKLWEEAYERVSHKYR